ncbi:MAG TPA: DUF255 domain-containing protein [Vicinamibacterales bacterium]|nr:DUF255 domain-containing protein [Vicinamibacterales bacterium]
MAAVDWLAWSADAFARARAEGKPVLLSITAPWCGSSSEMDRTTFADAGVAGVLNERFVAIRVDADRSPDIAERYSLGGWPTTAFLTSNGDIAGGGTFVSLDRMPAVLDRVLDAFRSRSDELMSATGDVRTTPASSNGSATADAVPEHDLVDRVYESYDTAHGGFGTAPKFPLTAPLDLALDTFLTTRDSRMAHIVQSTLDAIGWGALFDEVDGGFFRCAATHDWQSPHTAKLLETNAALLRIFIAAADVLKSARYRERAAEILRYAQTWLADQADGGWAGSQRADDGYYASAAAQRQARQPPPIDRTLFTSANALMVSAVLRAALAIDDTALGEFALRSLERVSLAAYKPGAGIAHYVDDRGPHGRGLLDDQIAMASAQLDAFDATGNIVYEMMAEELVQFAVRTMWDEREGGFFDRSELAELERIGLMRTRLKPFVANCEAARVLRRLTEATGAHDFADRSNVTLSAMARVAPGQGPLAAHYLLASAKAPQSASKPLE